MLNHVQTKRADIITKTPNLFSTKTETVWHITPFYYIIYKIFSLRYILPIHSRLVIISSRESPEGPLGKYFLLSQTTSQ
jgi:hypothetical protein